MERLFSNWRLPMWKTIDTAPRDGRLILVKVENRSPVVAYWSDWLAEHWQPVAESWRELEATEWTALPE
jgi:hypothetical protein